MGRQPCTVVRKDFMLSPGELEMEVTLDKQVEYKLYVAWKLLQFKVKFHWKLILIFLEKL